MPHKYGLSLNELASIRGYHLETVIPDVETEPRVDVYRHDDESGAYVYAFNAPLELVARVLMGDEAP